MFGMLVYETFTGTEPYAGHNNASASHEILSGQRPPRPSYDMIPYAVWELFESCTALDPARRPDMAAVHAELDTALLKLGYSEQGEDRPAARAPVAAAAVLVPSVLDVLLTRPYGKYIKQDVAEALTWTGVAAMVAGDREDVREFVATDSKAILSSAIADMAALARQYGAGQVRAAAVAAAAVQLCAPRLRRWSCADFSRVRAQQ